MKGRLYRSGALAALLLFNYGGFISWKVLLAGGSTDRLVTDAPGWHMAAAVPFAVFAAIWTWRWAWRRHGKAVEAARPQYTFVGTAIVECVPPTPWRAYLLTLAALFAVWWKSVEAMAGGYDPAIAVSIFCLLLALWPRRLARIPAARVIE